MLILNTSVLPIQSYEPKKNCLILENRGKQPLKVIKTKLHRPIQRIRNPIVEVSSSYLQKCGIFSRGDLIKPVVLECYERAHSNENEVMVPFLSYATNWREPRAPPTLNILPKSPDQNSEIAILFSIVGKPYNYVFRDDLLPQNPRGRSYNV